MKVPYENPIKIIKAVIKVIEHFYRLQTKKNYNEKVSCFYKKGTDICPCTIKRKDKKELNQMLI